MPERRTVVLAGLLPLLLVLGACSSSTAADDPASGSSDVTQAHGGALGGPAAGPDAKPAACDDGVKNGDETDVDCGGATCAKCDDGKQCTDGAGCTSGVCASGVCKAPACDDGVKNGDETDVDCGGPTCGKCDAGKACAANADCASDGCAYDKHCAIAPSCVGHEGGDTCGSGETGEAGAQHESCCTTLKVDRPAASGGPYVLDKYLVTAGRMRAFIERTGGNVRAAFQAKPAPAGWNASWTSQLPETMDDAAWMLGPWAGGRAGCQIANGTRTYWQSDAWNTAQGDIAEHYSQAILDEKVQNCAPAILLWALCAEDGGRLASSDEIIYAWRGTDNRAYPWGSSPSPTQDPMRANVGGYGHYIFPQSALDNSAYMNAPGRMTGNGPFGHADLMGPVLEQVRDQTLGLLWTGSLEGHASSLGISAAWGTRTTLGAYGMAGGRCAR
jgi:hypothetical protein